MKFFSAGLKKLQKDLLFAIWIGTGLGQRICGFFFHHFAHLVDQFAMSWSIYQVELEKTGDLL